MITNDLPVGFSNKQHYLSQRQRGEKVYRFPQYNDNKTHDSNSNVMCLKRSGQLSRRGTPASLITFRYGVDCVLSGVHLRQHTVSDCNFRRSSLNFPCLIAVKQYAYCKGGQINFWSHLREEKPEKPQKIHRNSLHDRIESIKSAGKRSQKVTLETCPWLFLEKNISRRIFVS